MELGHEVRIEPGAADIGLNRTHVVWRLDQVKATEIIQDLAVLSGKGGAGGPTTDTAAARRHAVATSPSHRERIQPQKSFGRSHIILVGEGGLEPPRPEGHWHLKPARLPFRHSP
jgi:hypothetical protein